MSRLIRRATMADKEAILKILPTIYRGGDYLPDYFNGMMTKPGYYNNVVEHQGDLVGYGCAQVIDGGMSLVLQGGRIKDEFKGQGAMDEIARHVTHALAGIKPVYHVNTSNDEVYNSGGISLNRKIRTLERRRIMTFSFDASHPDTHRKLSKIGAGNVTEVDKYYLRNLFQTPEVSRVLFPKGTLVVDWVPFQCLASNIDFLSSRQNTRGYRLANNSEDVRKCTMVTFGSYFNCNLGSAYNVDVYGPYVEDIQTHFIWHLNRAASNAKGNVCFQLYVDEDQDEREIQNIGESLGFPRTTDHYSFCYVLSKRISLL